MPTTQNLSLTAFGAGCIVPTSYSIDALTRVHDGTPVTRASKVLPQTATEAAFTITGGRIILLQLLGECTVVIQTQACNLNIQSNPTAAGASLDLCAVLNISAKAVGTLFGMTGTLANALQSGVAILAQATPLILPVGTIDLVTSASNTGEIKWDLKYVP